MAKSIDPGLAALLREESERTRINGKRISLGPQQKHYNALSSRRKLVDRVHIHVERRKIGTDINRRKGDTKSALYSKYIKW